MLCMLFNYWVKDNPRHRLLVGSFWFPTSACCEALVGQWSNKTYLNRFHFVGSSRLWHFTPINRSKSARIIFNFYMDLSQNRKSGAICLLPKNHGKTIENYQGRSDCQEGRLSRGYNTAEGAWPRGRRRWYLFQRNGHSIWGEQLGGRFSAVNPAQQSRKGKSRSASDDSFQEQHGLIRRCQVASKTLPKFVQKKEGLNLKRTCKPVRTSRRKVWHSWHCPMRWMRW